MTLKVTVVDVFEWHIVNGSYSNCNSQVGLHEFYGPGLKCHNDTRLVSGDFE